MYFPESMAGGSFHGNQSICILSFWVGLSTPLCLSLEAVSLSFATLRQLVESGLEFVQIFIKILLVCEEKLEIIVLNV